jgi:hypothetical protein
MVAPWAFPFSQLHIDQEQNRKRQKYLEEIAGRGLNSRENAREDHFRRTEFHEADDKPKRSKALISCPGVLVIIYAVRPRMYACEH